MGDTEYVNKIMYCEINVATRACINHYGKAQVVLIILNEVGKDSLLLMTNLPAQWLPFPNTFFITYSPLVKPVNIKSQCV